MKIAVIGAGNGGQAITGYLAMTGHDVRLYNRSESVIDTLKTKGEIELIGVIRGVGKPSLFTSDMAEAIKGAELIMVTTTAVAHREVAEMMAPLLEENQVVVLNPGRTGGALEFKQTLASAGCVKRVYVAEAQTLVYACRIVTNGVVNIIGVKDSVNLAAIPASDTDHVLHIVKQIYPCFRKAKSVLRTSLGNVGAVFHPCVLLFNAATVERQDEFYFYRDMTDQVGQFIEQFDAERLAVGKAYGISLMPVSDWISDAYPDTKGDTLCEKMRNNPAYYDIKSPASIYTRQLMEDIPTGVLPIMELGKAAGLDMRLHESMIDIISALLNRDFRHNGRTLEQLGLAGKSKEEIVDYLSR